MTQVLLKVPDAAEALSMSTRFVYREIRSGRLRAVKVGTVWRVPVDALDEYVQSLDSNEVA